MPTLNAGGADCVQYSLYVLANRMLARLLRYLMTLSLKKERTHELLRTYFMAFAPLNRHQFMREY